MLASRGYYVIRFDNRDIGQSTTIDSGGVPNIRSLLLQAMLGRSPRAPYTLMDMADDSVGLLDALAIPSVHVVGASMGGAIAQEMALRHRPRVRTLTSIMSTSGDPSLPPPTPEAMSMLMTPTPRDRDGYCRRHVALMKVLRGPGFPEDEARDLARAERAFARGVDRAGVARQFAAILASGSRKRRLAALDVPTLVLHDPADPLVRFACGLDVARTVPGAKLVPIEGMGHALPIAVWPRLVAAIAAHAVEPCPSVTAD
jgi:pimeloyl-ACP methyl ester carboxylesterase